jgi:hypothetical protein
MEPDGCRLDGGIAHAAQKTLLGAVSEAEAPDPRCTIKASIGRECIYHQPGGRWYAKMKMDSGKRWFARWPRRKPLAVAPLRTRTTLPRKRSPVALEHPRAAAPWRRLCVFAVGAGEDRPVAWRIHSRFCGRRRICLPSLSAAL